MKSIEWQNSIFFITIAVCFFYNVQSIQFVKKILSNFTKKMLPIYLCSLLNTIIIVLGYVMYFPQYLIYIVGIILFYTEFSLLSKATTRQKIFGSSVFFLHISTVHILVLTTYSQITTIPPLEIFNTFFNFFNSTTISYILLILALFVVDKKIKTADIIKLSNAKNYSRQLSIITISTVIFLSIVSFFTMAEETFQDFELIIIGTTLFCTLLFYYFFLYSMNFVTMYVYKRKKEEIIDSHTKIISTKQKIAQEIEKDDLTNLFTRKYMYEALEKLAEDSSAKYAVLFIDLNGLKTVNDTFGHKFGDTYICRVAKSIHNAIREDDLAGRVGGDEFIVVMNEIQETDIITITDRIQEYTEAQNELEEFTIAISIGSLYVDNSVYKRTCDEVVKIADEKMRENKKAYYEKKELLI